MSLEQVKVIIDRAIIDEEFYTQLMTQPEQTIKNDDLTEAERTMIKGLAKSPYTLAKKGLQDTQRLVVAALVYAPPVPKST